MRVTAWGHGGDIEGYHSFMAKTFDGPAISMTFTQDPDAASLDRRPPRRRHGRPLLPGRLSTQHGCELLTRQRPAVVEVLEVVRRDE